MGPGKVIVGVLVLVTMAMFSGGCGGSGGSKDSTSIPTGGTTSQDSTSDSGGSESESVGPEPSKEFLGSGPNGKLAKIGKESSVAEREAASRVLEDYFQAREDGDWKGQCELLSSSVVEQIERAVSLNGKVECASALGQQAKGLPASVRLNTMEGPIDALRINQGINGFAFYHGSGGKDYVIPLIKQDGWKVVALTTEEIR